MEIPDKAYLTALMEEAMKKSYDFKYVPVDENKLDITYIATKKRKHLGLQEGLSAQSAMKTYQVKEVSSVRSNCRFYNKFFKVNGKLHKVEAYVDGHDRLSTTYYACYEGNKRYLFEYIGYDAETKKNAVTIYVSVYDGDQVIEAYTIQGSHIIYEKYDYTNPSQVDYYYISYVPSGKYPVLGEFMKSMPLGRFLTLAEACLTCNTYDRLSKISCPVLVLGGEKDKVVTKEASVEIAKKLGCELVLYENYGHSAYEEAKDFNDKVLRFLLSSGNS